MRLVICSLLAFVLLPSLPALTAIVLIARRGRA